MKLILNALMLSFGCKFVTVLSLKTVSVGQQLGLKTDKAHDSPTLNMR